MSSSENYILPSKIVGLIFVLSLIFFDLGNSYSSIIFIVVMLLIGILYIIVGMWLESIPQIIIFTAIFFPLITEIGIDPVVFGIFTVMTCEIGFLTPPIGINLFVAARISKITIEEISVGVLPLLIPYFLMILILVFYSEWITYLPDLVYGPTR